MFTFSKPLHEITEADLQTLIRDGVVENRQLEYKRDFPDLGRDEKKEFVRDVVSFANSAGGHVIYGIAESDGLPKQFAPISEQNVDSATLQLESIIRTSVEPAIQGLKIHSVKLASGGYALIIEIPPALFGLHMIKGRRAFVARTSAGKYEMDVNEIRAAFVGAEAAVQRLNEFRADRTAKILSGDIQWALSTSQLCTIHLLPLVSFSSGYRCAINNIPVEVRKQLYPMRRYAPPFLCETFTFEGYANLISSGIEAQPVDAFSHIFRNGAIENVTDLRAQSKPDDFFDLHYHELLMMECSERMLTIVASLEIPGPYYLLIALLNVKGLKVIPGERRPHFLINYEVRTIDRQHLILPEILLENTGISIEKEMRSSFDIIWNAAGWPRSLSYDESGQYRHEDWRRSLRT